MLHIECDIIAGFLFLTSITSCLFNVTNKLDVTLIATYIPAHLDVEADYLMWVKLVPEWYLLPHTVKWYFNFGVMFWWICWYPHLSINVSITTLENLLPQKSHGVEHFQPYFEVSGELYICPSALVLLVLPNFQAEHVTRQFRLPILIAPYLVAWRLLGFPLSSM